MSLLIPDVLCREVADLTPQFLKKSGIDCLLLDFDNTIQAYTAKSPSESVVSWIHSLKAAGIALCVVSNSAKPRALPFCRAHDIPCIRSAHKPFPHGIRSAMRLFPDACGFALVGDQIYTDVLGANLCGAASVLVTPLHLHNVWLKLRHLAEKPWICLAERQGRRIPVREELSKKS